MAGIVVAVPVGLLAATTRMYTVAAASMMPALVKGDKVLVNFMAYDLTVPFTTHRVRHWSAPKAGDIVLFSVPNKEAGYIALKRVVAVPGDTVELRENRLFVNGQEATHEPLDAAAFNRLPADTLAGRRFEREVIGTQSRTIILTSESRAGRNFGPLLVPPDHYFLLGDYRDNSNDSRLFGPLDRNSIKGRLMMKLG